MFHVFVQHLAESFPLLWNPFYYLACFVGWYFCMGFGYAINGGQLGRSRWAFPFQCFWEELPCYLPGGRKHRIAFISERSKGIDGVMIGRTRAYDYSEIREKNLYEEVFFQMCGGRTYFWVTQLFVFFVSPFVVVALLCGGIISIVIQSILFLLRSTVMKKRVIQN